MSIDIAIFIGFLSFNLVFGIFSSRGIKNITEYAVGSRNFSTATITATIIATWIGSGFFYSAVSETYKEGLWHLIARCGDVLTLLIVAYTIAPRVGSFLGKISVAEIMGDLYGKRVRLITAIASILLSIGYVAVQIKALMELFYYFFGVSSIYATLLATFVITVYSTMGGIRAITFTDVIQFFTFGVFIPVFAVFLCNLFDNPAGSIITSTVSNPAFSVCSIFNFSDPKFYSFFILFLYYTVPGLDPATVQRILMAKDIHQVRKSFSLAAFFCFIIGGTACLIGIIMLAHNPNLDPDNLIRHVIDNYSYTGLKALTLVGITAMIMSSADSYINSAAVIFAHDLMKASRHALSFSRIFSVFVPIAATVLALSKTSLYDLLLLAGNFYTPVITMPLMLAIFGFRTSSKVALTAIFTGILTVIIWRVFIQSITGIDSIIPGTIVNLLTMLLMHYGLNESGGWMKTGAELSVNQTKDQNRTQKAKHFLFNLPLKIIRFNLISFSKSHTPKLKMTYVYAIFSAVSALIITLSIDRTVYNQHFNSINILLGTVLFIVTSLICQKLWSEDFRERYIGLIWLISVFIISSFISSFLVLVSNFTHISLVVLILNLTMIGILLRWQSTLIIIISGVTSSFVFYQQYIGEIHVSAELSDLKMKLIYILFMISSVLIAFFKPKQEMYEISEEKVDHLNARIQHREEELGKALELKNEFLRNISHEVRTPMVGITSLGPLLYDMYDKLEPEKVKSYLKDIADNSKRLESLMFNILDLSSLTSLSAKLECKLVNLSDLVRERAFTCSKLYLYGKDMDLALDIEDNLIISCDEYYIKQTIDNLIINAIHYGKDNSITIVLRSIRLITKEVNEDQDSRFTEVEFSVQDQGIGIPRDELYDIFGSFIVSSKTHTLAGGRGVGLALCKKVIDLHKGKIKAQSDGKQGATFIFVVPR